MFYSRPISKLINHLLQALIYCWDSQRAFRERKERHVKELEAKLNDLEQASTSLHHDNERLRRELAKVATENEILRATSSSHQSNQQMSGPQSTARPGDENMKTGPMKYTPSNFLTALRVHHSETHDSAYVALDAPPPADPSLVSSSEPAIIKHALPGPLITQAGTFTPNAHRTSVSPLTGQRLLASGVTWDYIQAHPLFQEGLVDITDVLESLKGTAECNGTGPAFEERRVIKAIEDSAAKAWTNRQGERRGVGQSVVGQGVGFQISTAFEGNARDLWLSNSPKKRN
jgi:AP-1-like transcription factor